MRAIVAALLVVACSGSKGAVLREDKCVAEGMSWRYSHTVAWTTREPVYEYHYDWQSGEFKYGYIGTKPVDHEKDIYDCLPRT